MTSRTLTLTAHAEKQAPPDALPHYQGQHPLLYHQLRTYHALEQVPLVMNTYPTGTGKTVAALLRLLHPDQRSANTLIIAPTNALIGQHTADTEAFLLQNNLAMRVFPVHAARLAQVMPTLRRGEVLHRTLENHLTFAQQLGLPDDAPKLPVVVVTNPDIFYLALFFQYHRNDQRNLFLDFLARFRYLIIDEFHYYDSKQFANFLFFFALWKQWGYFAHDRKICLLSATPRPQVYALLNRLEIGWQRIGPDNEPSESSAYPTTPTLTELHLTIAAGPIEDWASANRNQLAHWQATHLDTAIISSSLARINQLYDQVRHLDPARITGPEDEQERQRVRPLILATPTVDIGYNFGRPGKQRQSIDRLVCDARFRDELVQRIGRAGRVLGRQQTNQASEAVVLVSEEAAAALRAYAGQTFTRHEWAALLDGLGEVLPPKHQLAGYMQTHAIKESFYPIYHIHTLTANQEATLQELFTLVRDLYAPTSRQTADSFKRFFRMYDQRQRWLKLKDPERWQATTAPQRDYLAQQLAAYLSWAEQATDGPTVTYTARQVAGQLDRVLGYQETRAAVQAFVESRVALTRALFAFREAWQGPLATVADEQRLFSSQPVNQYDLLHLLASYELYFYDDLAAFMQAHGPVPAPLREAAVYAAIQGFRRPRWVIGFTYQSDAPRELFERRHCQTMTALCGLEVCVREQGSSGAWIPLDRRVARVLKADWVPCLVLVPERAGALLRVLRVSPFVARELAVTFPDGTERAYQSVTGTAAFHVEAELRGHLARLRGRQTTGPFFC